MRLRASRLLPTLGGLLTHPSSEGTNQFGFGHLGPSLQENDQFLKRQEWKMEAFIVFDVHPISTQMIGFYCFTIAPPYLRYPKCGVNSQPVYSAAAHLDFNRQIRRGVGG